MISILAIFLNFLKIGLFAFGGAYAVIPLIEEQMVTNTGWMTFEEFSDLVAIDELTPGPIIINSSTFIGMKLGGVPGALAATLACVIPGAIVALTLVYLYGQYKEIPVISEAIRVLKCMSVALIWGIFSRRHTPATSRAEPVKQASVASRSPAPMVFPHITWTPVEMNAPKAANISRSGVDRP